MHLYLFLICLVYFVIVVCLLYTYVYFMIYISYVFHLFHVTFLANSPRTQLNVFLRAELTFPLPGLKIVTNNLGHFGQLDWYMMHLGISVFDFILISECCSILL